MKYCSENHPLIRNLEGDQIGEFYCSCTSVPMNLLFNGKVNHKFRGVVHKVTDIVGCNVSSRALVYHAMLAIRKEAKGFVVPLDYNLFTKLRKENPNRQLPTYNSFTNSIEALVGNDFGVLYKGDHKTVPNRKYKSVFKLSDKFLSLFDEQDKQYFPSEPTYKYNDLIRVMSEKDNKGNRKRLDISPRGINKLRDEVREINEFLARFVFRTLEGDRIYPELYRSFVNSLTNFGRFYFYAQSLESSRRQFISVDGESMREDDLKSNHAFICAELAGFIPPEGFKPYSISESGLVTSVPAGGSERDVYKKGVVCLTTCTLRGATNAFKTAWKEDLSGYGGVENASQIMKQLKETNKDFLDVIGNHDAGSLQYIDSCILLEAMKYLMRRNEPFLPYHDSIMTRSSAGEITKEAFKYGWEKILGSKACCFIDRKY